MCDVPSSTFSMEPCFLMSASADLGPMPRMLPAYLCVRLCQRVWFRRDMKII